MKEFEEIYKQHFSEVYHFLYRLCGHNHHLAEELTQDTFCEAFRCYHKFNSQSTVTTWLCAIGKNLWFQYLRKHKHTVIDYELLSNTISDDASHDPQECAEQNERSKIIRKAIASLKPKYREVVWLRSVAEMPFAKIAQVMGISESSAKVLFFRAKNQLKEILKDEGFF